MEENIYEAPQRDHRFRNGVLCGVLGGVLLAVLVCLLINPYLVVSLRSGGLTTSETVELVDKLDTITRELDSLYLGEVDHESMLEEAYAAYVDSLGDRYTRYYTEEEYQDYIDSSKGVYAGIGVTVQMDEESGYLTIVSIQSGSPADGTEIRVGDQILAVDGTDVSEMAQDEIVLLIKGEEGTAVSIEFRHGTQGSRFTEELVRTKISMTTVRSEVLENGIGYLAIEEFDEVTTDQFETEISELTEQGIRGLVIDLRNNPGGRLDVVTSILDRILPEGIITYTEDKWGNQETFTSDAECLSLPLAVLVNGNSASASEVFAGAVKDYGVGTLVGTTTYGKGIVQRTMSLGDGSGLKVTMARYYTPNGNYIHGVGIEPDIEVELPEGISYSTSLTLAEDIQLQTAIEAVKTQLGE